LWEASGRDVLPDRRAIGVVSFSHDSAFVGDLATVTLIVILFRDGLEVDWEMLQSHWHLPARKLAIAMPVTVALVAVLAHALTGLNWTESFLLGALLMPRGADDGESAIPAHQRALYGLGLAFLTYGLTVLPPHGSGFIAVFVAAIVIGVRRPDLREHFEHGSGEIVEIVKLATFFVFGSLLTLHGMFSSGWAGVAIVAGTFLVARPVAVWVALAGANVDGATKLFMGWFGPRGIATMTFALLVLERNVMAGQQLYDIAALTVFASILAHTLSDTPGTNWIARRTVAAEQDGERGAHV
jgi:NhaP-type Na+/H+ or K+/H+ antiporter